MGRIYTAASRSVFEEPSYALENLTISDLLTSDRDSFIIEGIRFLQKGSAECNEYISALLKRLKLMSKEEIEKLKERLSAKEVICDSTGIQGIKYMYGYPLEAGEHYFNLLADEKTNTVAHIIIPGRKIIVHPWVNPKTGSDDGFLFGKWNKAIPGGHFYYGGTMQEALREFVEKGYTFFQARELEFSDDFGKATKIPSGKNVVVVKENVSLEKALSF